MVNDVFTWKIQYFIQWYNRLQAASKSLKTVDHNYLETPICFRQSTPIIYSQYPVWVQFVYILWFGHISIIICKFFEFGHFLHFVVWARLNPFLNKPRFSRVCSRGIWKTLWGKEKLLVTSIFSFSNSVLYPFWEHTVLSIKFKIVLCKLPQFGRV